MAAVIAEKDSIPVQIVKPEEMFKPGVTWEEAFQTRFNDDRNLEVGGVVPNGGLSTFSRNCPPQMNTLIAEWKRRRVPAVNGVFLANGHVHIIHAVDPPRNLPMTLPIEYETEFATLSPSRWTTAFPIKSHSDETSRSITLVGECGQGADGFVALQASENPESLLWIAFFDFSNPFEAIRYEGGLITVLNNLSEEWSFMITSPWLIEIRSRSNNETTTTKHK